MRLVVDTTDSGRNHLDHIRERFTRSAQAFTEFVLSGRAEEAERLAGLATEGLANARTAVDIACGPGTFAMAFAARLGYIIGVDFTPAMLAEGRQAANRAGITNLRFVLADANALPFRDESVDIVSCCYALHHLVAPAHVIGEMVRITNRGGRIAVADLIVPDGADPDLHNRIERIRDPSHATSLRKSELCDLLSSAGLRIRAVEQHQRWRDFDHWMQVAAQPVGSTIYSKTRQLLEGSLREGVADRSGYQPKLSPTGELEMLQVVVYLVAEKNGWGSK